MKSAEEASGPMPAIQNPKSKIQNSPPGFVPLTALQPASSPERDAAVVRERLAGARGRQFWRSLDELADTEEFHRYLEREFPHQAPRDMAPVSRREFFRLMGASLALAGVAGCSYQPPENIVPYVEQPEALVPGKPLFFATAFPRGGYAHGVLAESHMGRPIKLEGNPAHPASLGATDAFTQASLLDLYDPDRSQTGRYLGTLTTWEQFTGEVLQWLPALRRAGGTGLRIITETITSPTLEAQLRRLLARYPQARIHYHDPVSREAVREGARLAFGQEVQPVYRFDRARRVLSLDSDFLHEEPGSVRYARDLVVQGRLNRIGEKREMNRLYVVESTPTITGAYADHRLPVRPSQVEAIARAIAAQLQVGGAGSATAPQGVPEEWIRAVADDLRGSRGASLVVAGMSQPPAVHALAHAINGALGNIGQTVTFTAPVEVHFGAREGTLKELVDDMQAGRVEMLLIMGGNPAYTAPADVDFAGALRAFNDQKSGLDPEPDPERKQNKASIHFGLHDDETGALCQWHLPESHYLEAWSDARAYDGTVSIIQPLIQPLYGTRSAHELLALLLEDELQGGFDIVRAHWMRTDPRFAPRTPPGGTAAGAPAPSVGTGTEDPTVQAASPAFERFWHQALLTGTVPNTAAPAKSVAVRPGFATSSAAPAAESGLEIVFRPDPTIWDGRFANNSWLQELPKPLTQLTWDNAALMSPATARAQNLQKEQLVRLQYGGKQLDVPVWIVPGHPDGTVTLYLGYGRTRAGNVGNRTGFNAYLLRTSDSPGFGTGLRMERAGGKYDLVTAQHHFTVHGRDLIRVGTYDEYVKDPAHPAFMQAQGGHEGEHPSLYQPQWPSDRAEAEHEHPPATGRGHGTERGREQPPPPTYEATGYNGNPIPAWGMVVDTNACIGCNACVLACQSENNIATVGKDQVAMAREMHWLRIDTYYQGPEGNPQTVFEPVPCMHCEKAPCEPVCPVEATSHSAEGINEQTYNRCVGTRYCSNNCPYKVRHFNYFQYADQKTPTIQMMRNPDVTVRSRGVMEKCTFCVQRVNQARIEAEKEGREIRDGDVLTACQQVCPTQAIIFGDINDKTSSNGQGSRVRQLKSDPLNFGLLEELNTRPRTTFLAKLRNPNPAVPAVGAGPTVEEEARDTLIVQ